MLSTNLKLKLTLPLLLAMASCSSYQIRYDASPAPSSEEIQQARLEMTGCANTVDVGVTICYPKDQLKVRTDFDGALTYFSYGKDCNTRGSIAATPPYTSIPKPTSTKVCPLVVYYFPYYPGAESATDKIYGSYGEISVQPDDSYKLGAAYRAPQVGIFKFEFASEFVRGAYTSRQNTDVTDFNGSSFEFEPKQVGVEVVQVKLFRQDNSFENKIYIINFFSPRVVDLEVAVKPNGNNILVEIPPTVSVTAGDGLLAPTSDLEIKLPADYKGTLRSYTIAGRTLVFHIENGKVIWTL